jgi:hypothetical protein
MPNPLGPLFAANDGDAEELGMKVRDALKQFRPILPDLFSPGEGASRMRGLLASVVVKEAGKLRFEIMGVHGMHELLADSTAVALLSSGHRWLPSARARVSGLGTRSQPSAIDLVPACSDEFGLIAGSMHLSTSGLEKSPEGSTKGSKQWTR